MNQEMYLRKLKRRIKSLPDNERQTILDFYREIIQDKIENGESEVQAVAELGDVNILAQKILMENVNRKPVNVGKTVGIVLASFFGVAYVAMLTVAIFGAATFPGKVVTNSATTSVQGDAKADKTFTAPSSGVNSIRIEAENKAVNVIATDSDKITIDYVENKDEDYTITNDNGTLTMTNQSKRHGSFSFNFNWGDDNYDKITIQIPKKYGKEVSINTTNSVIGISNLSNLGNLSCKTTNSVIKMDQVSAQNIDIETQNAAITLQDTKASDKLSAETQNGKISLENISAQDIYLRTQNGIIGGTIDGAKADYTIKTRTTNAISNIQNQTGGSKQLTAETTNAIISINFAD